MEDFIPVMRKGIDYSPEMFSFQPGLFLGTALYSFFVKIGSFGRCLPGTVSHVWPASELTNQDAAYFFAVSYQAAQTPRGSLAPPSFHNSVALSKVVQTAQRAVGMQTSLCDSTLAGSTIRG